MKLKVQPSDGHPGCTYYMTLLQSNRAKKQIHVGDFVYVAPPELVLPAGDCWMKHVGQLGVYSVERLWSDSRLVRCAVVGSLGVVELVRVGDVAQCLGRQSLAGGLSRIYA